MKKWHSLPISAFLAVAVASCGAKNPESMKNQFTQENPFFQESTLPFQTIPFDLIKDEHFEPAFTEGLSAQLSEIEAIAKNPENPTFENTLVALEKSGQLLERVSRAFFVLSSANTNERLQKIEEEIAPRLAGHEALIYLNTDLFRRIENLYRQKEQLALDAESTRLLEYYYQKFVRSGAQLTDQDKERMKSLNQEEASLSAKFKNQLMAATKAAAVTVSDKNKLQGLSAGELAAAAARATENGSSGKWSFPIQNTTQQPELQSLTNRELRAELFEASWTRTQKNDENDTRKTIARIAQIRAEKANILGFENYAEWNLQDQMAKTPEAVEQFFAQLAPASTAKAQTEAKDIQARIDAQKHGFQLEPWDWNFYAEQVRKQRYDLNEEDLKPYFELDRVLQDGVFYAATRLYGLQFQERSDLPVYHPDVRVFTVLEENGDTLGLFYTDFFKRDNKSGGAWMDNFVQQSKLFGRKPVIYNVCNYTKPAEGQPAYLSFDEVTTLFHEFGHALHGFFADQHYPSLSGTNVARDFVELPSQFNENWALHPEVLNNYAKHEQTKETIPADLVEKIKNAATFNQGYSMTEILAASNLDLEWHRLKADAPLQDVDSFETQALKKTGLLMREVPPRYRSSYFLHSWGHGYAASYYAYLWSEMLHHDAYAWFEQNGGLTRANGQRFRERILSIGNTKDLTEAYRNFTGQKPSMKPMLRKRGLLPA